MAAREESESSMAHARTAPDPVAPLRSFACARDHRGYTYTVTRLQVIEECSRKEEMRKNVLHPRDRWFGRAGVAIVMRADEIKNLSETVTRVVRAFRGCGRRVIVMVTWLYSRPKSGPTNLPRW